MMHQGSHLSNRVPSVDAHLGTGGPVIEFTGVSKRFTRARAALDAVSLQVPAGEVTVLLGASGSGKSTLLRHVDGLHRPTAGTVRVLGVDVGAARGPELRRLRRRIGFVFQQFNLVGSLTALENVCTGALGTLRGPRLGLPAYPKRIRREALAHLERVGLAVAAFQRADTLSGGQQQRVAVARALMQRPEILLADEPVASLDPASAEQVMTLISDISRSDRLTVLCSLHQVEIALSFGQRVIGLREGRVVLDRPMAQVDRATALTVYGAHRPAPAPALAGVG